MTSISDYLNRADQQLDMVRRSLGTARRTWGPARRIEGPEQVSADIAVAQVRAMQALAAAIDHLAAAAESTAWSAPGYQRGIEVRRPDEDAPLTIVASGFATVLTYALVVAAFRRAPVGYVVSLRECSVVLAAVIGWRFLGEESGPRRVTAACTVAAGVVLLVVAV